MSLQIITFKHSKLILGVESLDLILISYHTNIKHDSVLTKLKSLNSNFEKKFNSNFTSKFGYVKKFTIC